MSTIAACPREPDNQGNQNLHLRDSLLVFGSGSERLPAKSYGSTPLFAAARSFSANVGSNLYWVYRGLDSLPFGEEIRSFYLFEGMGSFSQVKTGRTEGDPASMTRAPLRVMQVILALADRKEGLTLNALSEQMEVPKTSLFNLLRTLQSADYIENEHGLYRLGRSTYQLASIISKAHAFPDNVRPVFERLARECRQTVMLGVPGERWMDLVYVDVIQATDWLSFRVKVGAHRPMYSTAGGMALLAFSAPARREKYLAEATLDPLTDKTITTRGDLEIALAEFRRQGYALGEGSVEGATGLSTPIFDVTGEIVAAVVMAGVSSAIHKELERHVGLLKRCAEEMSRILGYIGAWPPGEHPPLGKQNR